MKYVLQRRERNAQGKIVYVAPRDSDKAYTTSLAKALSFLSEEFAQADAGGNEFVVFIGDTL